MPYTIIKSGDKYQLRNQSTGKVMKRKFLTRESAKNASQSIMKNKSKGKSKSDGKKSKY